MYGTLTGTLSIAWLRWLEMVIPSGRRVWVHRENIKDDTITEEQLGKVVTIKVRRDWLIANDLLTKETESDD